MSLTLYYHPLASFCWKPLIALYENATAFTPHLVDLANEQSRNEFYKVWKMGQFPVLMDSERKQIVPQSSAMIEYLSLYYPGEVKLIPQNAEAAWEARRWDSFYDTYVHVSMQKIVTDVIRPEGKHDPFGVDDARATIRDAYEVLEVRMHGKTWCVGEAFSIADCSAAPALFYANKVEPLGGYKALASYLERLQNRPSFSRVIEEAQPYFHMFPYKG